VPCEFLPFCVLSGVRLWDGTPAASMPLISIIPAAGGFPAIVRFAGGSVPLAEGDVISYVFVE